MVKLIINKTMEISNYTTKDPEGLEALFKEYESQIMERKITPELIVSMELSDIGPNDGFIVAREIDEPLLGILQYQLTRPQSFEEFDSQFWEHFRTDIVDNNGNPYRNMNLSVRTGFRKYNFNEDFAYIEEMESFQREKGVGRTLVDSLMSWENVGGIYLQSDSEVVGFYEKMGFKHSGLHFEEVELPIMVWMKSGFY